MLPGVGWLELVVMPVLCQKATQKAPTKVRTLRFTVKLSKSQHRRLDTVLGMQRELYNAGLEAWRTGYRFWQDKQRFFPGSPKMRFSYIDNCKTLTELRNEDPAWEALDARVARSTLQRLDATIRGFYSGERGYPRFKSYKRWRSVSIPDAHMGMLKPPQNGGKWWRLRVKGLPWLRFDGERLAELAAEDGFELLELRLVRTALRTELQTVIREPVPATVAVSHCPVGLDAGIKQRFTLSDGGVVPQRQHERQEIKRHQRAVSRAEKGSNSRSKKITLLRKAHARQTEARRDEDYRQIADLNLVTRFDGIAVEDLQIANMMRNRRLADKIGQQGWAAFATRLQHKAERAGLQFVRVPAHHTSQECSNCGHRLTDLLTLKDRTFVCPQCGLEECRDVNAAINIRDRGFPPAIPGGSYPGARRVTKFGRKTNRPPIRCLSAQNYTGSAHAIQHGHYPI